MRIGLLGQFGSGNSGNDGSLEAMVRFLRRAHPDADLVCICSNPAVVADNLGIDATSVGAVMPDGRAFARMNGLLLGVPRRLLSLAEAFRRTRDLDWVVVPGTGILDDFRENPFGWPFVLWRWCAAARLNGARIAFVSIGAGPIRHPLSRRLMKWAAGLASYRSYRDKISRDFMAGIGLDVRQDSVVPDIVFGLPLPQPQAIIPRRSLTVGIGVMSYRGWSKKGTGGEYIYETYLKKLARFALRLLEDGHHLRLLTGDKGDGPAIQDFFRHLARLSPRRFQTCITTETALSLAELMRQMQETDIVIASRYHNIVCALKLGIPTISLSYAEKNDAIMAECGLGDLCQHIEAFDVGILAGQFRRLVADREAYASRVRQSVMNIVESVSRQETWLSGSLLERNSELAIKPLVYPIRDGDAV